MHKENKQKKIQFVIATSWKKLYPCCIWNITVMGGTFIFTENGEAQWWCNYLVDCSDALLSLLLFLVFSLRGGGGEKRSISWASSSFLSFFFKKIKQSAFQTICPQHANECGSKGAKTGNKQFHCLLLFAVVMRPFQCMDKSSKSLFKIPSFSIKL